LVDQKRIGVDDDESCGLWNIARRRVCVPLFFAPDKRADWHCWLDLGGNVLDFFSENRLEYVIE
jgi:hypothetical protein